jgi:uncharacterized protein YabN with tetrapyrrole methylase and pyrophosphatase domain
MANETSHLDEMQQAYKATVDEWVDTIRAEESLCSQAHSLVEVDKWEAAHFREEEFRNKAKKAKKAYEDAIRKEFFGF